MHRPKGAKVIAQGDAGKEFYIIMQGEAAVTVKDGSGATTGLASDFAEAATTGGVSVT